MKIVIADDSAMVRERIISTLNDVKGVEVTGEADNAKATMEKVEELKPDAVILDIGMPGNGISIIKAIKDRKKPPVVIMFTNYSYEQYEINCLEEGADFFFNKSEGIEKITEVLNKTLSEKDNRD
ncbi:response regulator transcription factor [candidate division KSB1 bacterium]